MERLKEILIFLLLLLLTLCCFTQLLESERFRLFFVFTNLCCYLDALLYLLNLIKSRVKHQLRTSDSRIRYFVLEVLRYLNAIKVLSFDFRQNKLVIAFLHWQSLLPENLVLLFRYHLFTLFSHSSCFTWSVSILFHHLNLLFLGY